MRKNQLKIGAILSYIILGIKNIISIVYTPIMLKLLGQAEYGLFNLSNSVVGYLGILNLGLGSSIVRYITKYKTEGNKEAEYNLNGMFIVVYSIISLIVIVCGAVLIINADLIFSGFLSTNELNISKILMLLMIFNMAISFPLGVFGSIINAYECFIFPKVMELLTTISSPFIILPLLLMGHKSITMTIVSTIINIISMTANIIYCFKVLKIKVKFNNIQIGILKEILNYSFFIFIAMIVDKIYWSTDQVILGITNGTKEVAIYSIGSTISTIFISLTSVIGGFMLPRFTRLVSQKVDDRIISDEFIKISRIQFIICTYIYGGFLLIGKKFMTIWAGSEYETSFYVALLIMTGLVGAVSQNTGLAVLQAKALHKFRAISMLIIAIINIFITAYLSPKYGSIGAAFSTFIAYFFGNNIIISIYYHKKAKLDVISLWKQLIKFVPTFIIIGASSFFVNSILDKESYLDLFIIGGIYTIVYSILVFNINMNNYEKNILVNTLKNISKTIAKKKNILGKI